MKIYFNESVLPKWYDNYENTITSVEYIADGSYILTEVHLIGEGHDTHEYVVWTYEFLEDTKYGQLVKLKEMVSEWSR